jgi:hypothetical protein
VRDMPDSPIVCTLSPDDLRQARQALLTELLPRADEHHLVDNGCRLRFESGGDVLGIIAKTIERERKCCRFLRFQLTVEPESGAIWLELTGPPGTREFLAQLLEG